MNHHVRPLSKAPLAAAHPTLLRSAVVAILVVWALRDLALLVGYSVLLAYALLPFVRAIERLPGSHHRPLPKGLAAGAVMLVLVSLVGWAIVLAVPRVVAEASNFASNAPEVLNRLISDLHRYASVHEHGEWLDTSIERLRVQAPLEAQRFGRQFMDGATNGGSAGTLLCLTLLPLLAFYLLADSNAVRLSTLRFIPEEARAEILTLGWAVDRALRSYVRGQVVVCVVTGVSVALGLAIMRHPAALLLGVVAGTAELLPFLGFLVTATAIAFAGSAVGGLQAVLGVSLYASLNWGIGTFVTPRLMGRYLKMHPFVVTVSVLAGAQLLGPAGALLALPGAAVLQAIIGELAPEGMAAERVRAAIAATEAAAHPASAEGSDNPA